MLSLYRGKKVLVSGHTGFKGSWLSLWLNMLGAQVYGISDRVPTTPSNFDSFALSSELADFRVDVRDLDTVVAKVDEIRPDFVFHLAAQPIVRASYFNPIETFTTNAIGTLNILEAFRKLDRNVVVVCITSDKVYKNNEWVWGYRETDEIGGDDPYSASKGMAELAINSYVRSYLLANNCPVRVGVARAGNVIGGGDWATERIVPDCIRSWARGESVIIRNPGSTRPWQHVLEPLGGYLMLGSYLMEPKSPQGEAFNFGPITSQDYSVEQLISQMSSHWQGSKWRVEDPDSQRLPEAGLLKLDCSKAEKLLSWRPVYDFQKTVSVTLDWYKSYFQIDPEDLVAFSQGQIREYVAMQGWDRR